MEPNEPLRKRNKKYDIPGHARFLTFSCYRRLPLLTNDLFRQWLADSVRKQCDACEIALWAYVFMPEHVHLLLKPRREIHELADFEQRAKLSWSRKMIVHLKRTASPLLSSLKVGTGYRLWQAGGGHDLNIWTLKKAIEKAEYCHNNPVKRRLVASPELWRWSSFRSLVQGHSEGEPLRVDPWDERLLDEGLRSVSANELGLALRTGLNGETRGTRTDDNEVGSATRRC